MAEPFVAEIRIFAGNFAPRGWAFCDGQLLPISQNTAVFSLIGTTYGGNGQSTMALPDLQGRAPMHPGRGPGLTSRQLGQQGGAEDVTLTEAQIPNHNHHVLATSSLGENPSPEGANLARSVNGQIYNNTSSNMIPMAVESIGNKGGSQSHNNMQPYLTVNYIIALVGLYPSRA